MVMSKVQSPKSEVIIRWRLLKFSLHNLKFEPQFPFNRLRTSDFKLRTLYFELRTFPLFLRLCFHQTFYVQFFSNTDYQRSVIGPLCFDVDQESIIDPEIQFAFF